MSGLIKQRHLGMVRHPALMTVPHLIAHVAPRQGLQTPRNNFTGHAWLVITVCRPIVCFWRHHLLLLNYMLLVQRDLPCLFPYRRITLMHYILCRQSRRARSWRQQGLQHTQTKTSSRTAVCWPIRIISGMSRKCVPTKPMLLIAYWDTSEEAKCNDEQMSYDHDYTTIPKYADSE